MLETSRPFEGHRLKYGRSKEHFLMLQDEIARFLQSNPYQLIGEFHTDAIRQQESYVVRVQARSHPPDHWSLIIGDCLYNLRSGLDHLVRHLSKRHSGTADGPTEFPIFKNRDSFHKMDRSKNPSTPTRWSGLHKIRLIDPTAQTIIEGLQPYYRRDGPIDLHPLWLLHELSNEDKHAALHFTGAVATGPVRVILEGATGRIEASYNSPNVRLFRYGAFEDGAHVMTLGTYRTGLSDGEVQLEGEISFDVAFSQEGPGRGMLMLYTLTDIARTVANVFNALEPYV